jgi:aubergine-like protein
MDYYLDQYNIKIRQPNQPLLVSMVKSKDRRPGQENKVTEQLVLLIRELCVLTGTVLLKEFERDFAMKKDLDAITKLNPEVRYTRLRKFLDTIKKNPESQKELENWQVEFSSDVVKVNATILPTVTVVFQNVSNKTNFRSLSNIFYSWNFAKIFIKSFKYLLSEIYYRKLFFDVKKKVKMSLKLN